MLNNKIIKLMMSNKKVYIFFSFICFFSYTLNAQSNEKLLENEGEDLFVYYEKRRVLLKEILNTQACAQFYNGVENKFYISYEYYASSNKSLVIYSLSLMKEYIKVNQVIHFNEREGIPYGWIYYCNMIFSISDLNYDTLTGIRSQLEYDILDRNECIVKIKDKCGKLTAESKVIRGIDSLIMVIPLFYKDKGFFGEGEFVYKSKNLTYLSQNFPIHYLQTNFCKIIEPLNVKNVRFLNDIAFYLEQGGSYKESIYFLKKILEYFPNRIVAYINLGDSYWGIKDITNARDAYNKYSTLMKKTGKETKIPKRIFNRLR